VDIHVSTSWCKLLKRVLFYIRDTVDILTYTNLVLKMKIKCIVSCFDLHADSRQMSPHVDSPSPACVRQVSLQTELSWSSERNLTRIFDARRSNVCMACYRWPCDPAMTRQPHSEVLGLWNWFRRYSSSVYSVSQKVIIISSNQRYFNNSCPILVFLGIFGTNISEWMCSRNMFSHFTCLVVTFKPTFDGIFS